MWFRALVGASASLVLVAVACSDDYASADVADGGAADTGGSVQTPPMDSGAAVIVDAGPSCDPRAPFTSVLPVPGVPAFAFSPRLVPDESIIFYSVEKETRTATRDDAGVFGIGTKVGFEEANPNYATVSADRTLVFYEDFFSVAQQSGAPGGPYSAKTVVPAPADLGISAPSYDEPRKQLYVTLHIAKNDFFGNTAIAVAPRSGGAVGAFRRIDVGFGTTGGEEPHDANTAPTYQYANPTPSADGLALYFATTRTEDGGAADWNVWVATRTSLDTDFGNPTRLDSVNTAHYEAPTWISPDGCRLYFQTDRAHPAEFKPADSFVATREP